MKILLVLSLLLSASAFSLDTKKICTADELGPAKPLTTEPHISEEEKRKLLEGAVHFCDPDYISGPNEELPLVLNCPPIPCAVNADDYGQSCANVI